MSISTAQYASAATGGTRASGLTMMLGAVPTNGNTLALVVAWDANPSGGGSGITISSVSGALALNAFAQQGSICLSLYRLTGTISGDQSVTVNFSGGTYASAFIIETSAPASVIPTVAVFGSFGTNQVVGNLPTSWAPAAGDLPFGFFAARDASTVSAQAGWTELVDLNNTSGQFSQLEVQQGPTTASSPQNVTVQATWSGSPSDSSNIAMLVVFSSSPPIMLSSQEPLEVIGYDTANSRASQEPLEVLAQHPLNARSSQEPLEVIGYDTANSRASQVVMEVLILQNVHVSQEPLEVLSDGSPNARTSQVVVEVLWNTLGAPRRKAQDDWITT